MCVIAVCEQKRPTLEQLTLMESRNRDGIGMAWQEAGKVRYAKGLTLEALFALTEVVPMPFVVHFRLATVGGNRPLLCHPFPVAGDSPLELEGVAGSVLFHNGHISNWKQVVRGMLMTWTRKGWRLPKKEWSDSRALAVMAGLHGVEALDFFEEGQRFAVLDGVGVRTWGHWEDYEGYKVSNTHFKPYVAAGYTMGFQRGWFDADDDSGWVYDGENWRSGRKPRVKLESPALPEGEPSTCEGEGGCFVVEKWPAPGLVYDDKLAGYINHDVWMARHGQGAVGT